MFRKWFRKTPAPLTGAPSLPRIKMYSSASGYVYQYTYAGHRPSRRPSGLEFVFSAAADRKTWYDLRVLIAHSAVNDWERAHDRTLSSTEWYALAKLALFAAFDERPSPEAVRAAPIEVRAADITAFMLQLDPESSPE